MTNPTMSAEERASEIVASLEAEFNVKIPLSWETGVANDIRHAEQAKEQAAYERASRFASRYTGPGTKNVHPDVQWEDMNETAQHVAHSTAQGIACGIGTLAKQLEEVG